MPAPRVRAERGCAPRADLLVVGAGPAGLATAIEARLGGLEVIVLDACDGPVDKACGEGIMPGGVRALQRLGVDVSGGMPFRGVRYLDEAHTVEAGFRSGMGLGVRRTELSRALFARARQLGVDLRPGHLVRDWRHDHTGARVRTDAGDFEACLLVAADGLHSRIRRRAGLELPARGPRRFGLRRHYRLRPWSDHVEVYWSPGAEAYVTPVAEDEVGVAFLHDGRIRDVDAAITRLPRLAAHLAGAPACSRPRGAGPLRQRVRCRWAPGLALVGDAAGYVDAITGEGITLALTGAPALVRNVLDGEPPQAYERAWLRTTRGYRVATEALGAAAGAPFLRRRLVATLAMVPPLFELGLAVAEGAIGGARPARVSRTPSAEPAPAEAAAQAPSASPK